MIDLITMGENISKARKMRGFTQERLAEKMEVTTQYISAIEHGKANISMRKFCVICEILNIKPNQLLGAEQSEDIDLQRKIYYLLRDCSSKDKEIIIGVIISLKRLLRDM